MSQTPGAIINLFLYSASPLFSLNIPTFTYLPDPLLLLAVRRSCDVKAVRFCVYSLSLIIPYESELFVCFLVCRFYRRHSPQRDHFCWRIVGFALFKCHQCLGCEHKPAAEIHSLLPSPCLQETRLLI